MSLSSSSCSTGWSNVQIRSWGPGPSLLTTQSGNSLRIMPWAEVLSQHLIQKVAALHSVTSGLALFKTIATWWHIQATEAWTPCVSHERRCTKASVNGMSFIGTSEHATLLPQEAEIQPRNGETQPDLFSFDCVPKTPKDKEYCVLSDLICASPSKGTVDDQRSLGMKRWPQRMHQQQCGSSLVIIMSFEWVCGHVYMSSPVQCSAAGNALAPCADESMEGAPQLFVYHTENHYQLFIQLVVAVQVIGKQLWCIPDEVICTQRQFNACISTLGATGPMYMTADSQG